MNILVLHAHTANRGDESAIKAMVDEISSAIENVHIVICINGNTFYPNMPDNVKQIGRVPKLHSKYSYLCFWIYYLSRGKIVMPSSGIDEYDKALREADLVIHAPGEPSIGDIYKDVELLYLMRLNLAGKMGKPYMFYAPSMGPFNDEKRSRLRKKVLKGAKKILLRDPISIGYLKDFIPESEAEHAFDSALQHDIDIEVNAQKCDEYAALKEFIGSHKRCIGITITDLKWHPSYKNTDYPEKIEACFKQFIEKKVNEGFGIVFVPQLYGSGNDTELMERFMLKEHAFMVDAFEEKYDAYFQQYVIGKLYAVVGMRYHSNIFSAKMATPFVSIAYEQKMSGFMRSVGLSEYCMDLKDLSYDALNDRFECLEGNYGSYKNKLIDLHDYMKKESHKSTDAVIEILEGK